MHPHGVLTLRREDGKVICERVRVADTWLRRMRGLLFRRTLASDEGCVLRPGFSIHTMFMQFPIDVVFVDQDLKVMKISAAVRPFRTAGCRGAREVVELRAGECARRGLAVGDRVAWASYQANGVHHADPDTEGATPAPTPGTVVIASRDTRFVKLMRYLLETGGVDCVQLRKPEELVDSLARLDPPVAVVLDAEQSMADALTQANAVRAQLPDAVVLLAAADRAGESSLGTRAFDKWGETEALAAAARAAVEGSAPPSA